MADYLKKMVRPDDAEWAGSLSEFSTNSRIFGHQFKQVIIPADQIIGPSSDAQIDIGFIVWIARISHLARDAPNTCCSISQAL